MTSILSTIRPAILPANFLVLFVMTMIKLMSGYAPVTSSIVIAGSATIIGCHVEETDEPPAPGTEAYAKRIRTARAKISPMEESLLPKITEQYNLDVGEYGPKAEHCLTYRDEFARLERLTLFPAAYIAGIALHESAGCDMAAMDWAGGVGLMQITTPPSKAEKKDAALILGIDAKELDWKKNVEHNILVGIIRLDWCEREFKSRFHGLLAYNRGAGNVRRDMRNAGWEPDEDYPTILKMKPHIPHTRKMKPRVYVQKVIATTIMMDHALHGETIKKVERTFRPSDVPGWEPAEDGENWKP
ncbi:MAG: transglycosylase SLT domain-containing protein [Patescibacteria group bacterium]